MVEMNILRTYAAIRGYQINPESVGIVSLGLEIEVVIFKNYSNLRKNRLQVRLKRFPHLF